jgi:UDP-3-O-[3-hydroxymyristoyl] glucosamine N-acyltransferase
MQFTAAQIALLINGQVEGDATVAVSSFGQIEEAKAGQLSFLANPKYEDFLYQTQALFVIINQNHVLKQPVHSTFIRVEDAYAAFAALISKYQQLVSEQLTGIEQPSYIAPTAQLGENIYIVAFVYIGKHAKISNKVKLFPGVVFGDNVTIDDNTILHAGVKVYKYCQIGKYFTIHAGTVIGGDGFGFGPLNDGSYKKVPQMGNVIIEDNVEIGSNATIDGATIGSTIIHCGAKLDNLIQIAHNVEIGQHTVIAAQAGVSGSTKVGNHVMVGGQAGIVGRLTIADGSKIIAQSGVSKSIKQHNSIVTGTQAFEYTTTLRSLAASRKLPILEKRVMELEKLVQQLLAERVTS